MLDGYKTYIAAGMGLLPAAIGIAELIDPTVAGYLLAIEGFLAAIFLRMGIKTDTATPTL